MIYTNIRQKKCKFYKTLTGEFFVYDQLKFLIEFYYIENKLHVSSLFLTEIYFKATNNVNYIILSYICQEIAQELNIY